MTDTRTSAPERVTRHVWSLRSILVASLMAFLLVPACLVGWTLYRSNVQAVDALSQKLLQGVAQRVQIDVENQLNEAHTVLNGIVSEQPDALGLQRTRVLLTQPELFEQSAFVMTRMSPNFPYLYLGSANGEFLGVERVGAIGAHLVAGPIAQNASDFTRVGVRKVVDAGRRFYSAAQSGDRSRLITAESTNFEPRNRPWYLTAIQKKGRTFTPIYPSISKKQLLITLAQPVYAEDGSALGVVAVDVYLKRLSEMLQTMQISARGAAFLVDEQGFLVASSTGEALYTEKDGKLERTRPSSSANPVVRRAYDVILPHLNQTLESSVQRVSFTRKVGTDDGLLVDLKPFGDRMGLGLSLVVTAPESDFAGETQAALTKTIGIISALVLLAAGVALLLAYRLSLRFKQLGQAAVQLAMGDVPDVQTSSHVQEVRRLSQIMHDSAQEIVNSRAALQAKTIALVEANESLEVRVASRTAALEASREEALGAVRAKAAFLATMSHEIRTPLNGVVGMTTLLADTPLNPEQSDYVHTMRVSSDQLLGVINDILDFSKIESGKLDLEAEPLNLMATIEEACDIGAPRAREKGLELLVDMDDHLPAWVRGDVTRLRQVLLNFIKETLNKSTPNRWQAL